MVMSPQEVQGSGVSGIITVYVIYDQQDEIAQLMDAGMPSDQVGL